MAMCDVCGKTRTYGHSVSHAKNRTNRDWLPNVQSKKLLLNGQMQRIDVCTRCLRTLSKPARMATRPVHA